MVEVIWTRAAYLVLEGLSQATAFGIFRLSEHLARFPELGSQILRPQHLTKYRQIIYKKTHRTIYRYDKPTDCVIIVNLQNCRQMPPTAKQIHRAENDDRELPLE